jgi:hypothetical protein
MDDKKYAIDEARIEVERQLSRITTLVHTAGTGELTYTESYQALKAAELRVQLLPEDIRDLFNAIHELQKRDGHC